MHHLDTGHLVVWYDAAWSPTGWSMADIAPWGLLWRLVTSVLAMDMLPCVSSPPTPRLYLCLGHFWGILLVILSFSPTPTVKYTVDIVPQYCIPF